jgi:hypothetical protein
MDAFAANIAQSHNEFSGDDKVAKTLVTASVDSLQLRAPFPMDKDLLMSGVVTWTGNSSLEVKVEISLKESREQKIMVSATAFIYPIVPALTRSVSLLLEMHNEFDPPSSSPSGRLLRDGLH